MSSVDRARLLSGGAAVALSAVFIAVVTPVLGVLSWEYDEGVAMLAARQLARGLRPFVDFAVHQPPLHLYLLEWSARVFGESFVGYRMLSVVSVAATGVVLFALVRPYAGAVPALIAQAVYLFSPTQVHALAAVAEAPMVCVALLGVAVLLLVPARWSAAVAGVLFVIALLIKATCLVMVVAAALSVVYARDWRRLAWLVGGGVIASAVALVWLYASSDGIFGDVVRYTAQRVGTRTAGLWDIESGFPELRGLLGITTRGEWTWFCFKNFWFFPEHVVPLVLFVVAFAGLPAWVRGCGREHRAVRAFAVLWPAAWLVTNFAALDYVSAKYFVPFASFAAFLLAGVAWWAQRSLSMRTSVSACALICALLVAYLVSSLGPQLDPWYYGRADWVAQQQPRVLSFSAFYFAATGREPQCGLWNAPDTYGSFGAAILGPAERLRRFQVTDEELVGCLRDQPDVPVLIDFWFYYFTRPGSSLREYLRGEGSGRRLFFSPQALTMWDDQAITLGAVAR